MISDKLKQCILNELRIESFEITPDTLANEIPGWDSLNHINVITAIEKSFSIRFSAYDILKCQNIGDLQNLINKKSVQT